MAGLEKGKAGAIMCWLACNEPKIKLGHYQPFAGSGSQLIAAEQLNRRCFAMEIEPRYCDVIVNRYAALKNEDPKKYFNQTERKRRKSAS